MPTCSCDGKKAAPGAPGKSAAYTTVLDTWWPRSAPLPPAMPWLGMRASRAGVERAISTYGALLPALPVSGAAAGTDPRNIEVLMDFAFRVLSTERASSLIMAGDESCCAPSCNTCADVVADPFMNPCGAGGDPVVAIDEGGVCVVECWAGGEYNGYVVLEADKDGCYNFDLE